MKWFKTRTLAVQPVESAGQAPPLSRVMAEFLEHKLRIQPIWIDFSLQFDDVENLVKPAISGFSPETLMEDFRANYALICAHHRNTGGERTALALLDRALSDIRRSREAARDANMSTALVAEQVLADHLTSAKGTALVELMNAGQTESPAFLAVARASSHRELDSALNRQKELTR